MCPSPSCTHDLWSRNPSRSEPRDTAHHRPDHLRFPFIQVCGAVGHPAPRLAPATPRSCPASWSLLPTQEPAGLESAFLENLMSPPSLPAPTPLQQEGGRRNDLVFIPGLILGAVALSFLAPAARPSPLRQAGGRPPTPDSDSAAQRSLRPLLPLLCLQNSRGPPTLAFLGEDVGAPIFKREARGTQKPMARGAGEEGRQSRWRLTVPYHSE